jgi:hypothetical protein
MPNRVLDKNEETEMVCENVPSVQTGFAHRLTPHAWCLAHASKSIGMATAIAASGAIFDRSTGMTVGNCPVIVGEERRQHRFR